MATLLIERGNWAASISVISRFFGFSTISFFVADKLASFLSLITPLSCKRSNALASFVASLGTAILSPSFNSSNDLIVVE